MGSARINAWKSTCTIHSVSFRSRKVPTDSAKDPVFRRPVRVHVHTGRHHWTGSRDPEIHNIYLDEDWDNNNPDAPTVAELNSLTKDLVSSGYLDAGGVYGINNATLTGSPRSGFC